MTLMTLIKHPRDKTLFYCLLIYLIYLMPSGVHVLIPMRSKNQFNQ